MIMPSNDRDAKQTLFGLLRRMTFPRGQDAHRQIAEQILLFEAFRDAQCNFGMTRQCLTVSLQTPSSQLRAPKRSGTIERMVSWKLAAWRRKSCNWRREWESNSQSLMTPAGGYEQEPQDCACCRALANLFFANGSRPSSCRYSCRYLRQSTTKSIANSICYATS